MNIQYKKNNGIRILMIILSIVGLIAFIIGLVLLIKSISFNSNSEQIEVTVESCEKHIENNNGTETISYQVYVNYSYDGKLYEHILVSGLDEQKANGDLIKVNINKNNHEDIRYMTKTTIWVIVLMVIGLGFCGGFAYLYIVSIISYNDYKEIIKNGRKIEGKVIRIYPDGNVYNNRNQYYKLDCESMEKIFTSKAFKNGLDISQGDIVPVYYTSLRKNKYFVDVENVKIMHNSKEDNWTFKM